MFRYIIYFMTILAFTSNIIAGTREESIPDNKYIEYGKKFKYIYKICGTYKDGKLFCGSAIVIDRHWILTAAHVVDNHKFCVISQDDETNTVDEIIVHEDFIREKFGSADIALGYMKKPINLDFYPALYEDKDEINKICCISGYGITGTFKTGANLSDDKKRAGSNMVESIDRELLVCNASTNGDRKTTELEFLIASGDSGGGLFIDGKLAGINSIVLAADKKPDSSYGDESAHTRISSYVKWIRDKMNSKGTDRE